MWTSLNFFSSFATRHTCSQAAAIVGTRACLSVSRPNKCSFGPMSASRSINPLQNLLTMKQTMPSSWGFRIWDLGDSPPTLASDFSVQVTTHQPKRLDARAQSDLNPFHGVWDDRPNQEAIGPIGQTRLIRPISEIPKLNQADPYVFFRLFFPQN